MEPVRRKPFKKLDLSELREACSEGNQKAVREILAGSEPKRSVKSPSRRSGWPFFTQQESDELTLPVHTACRSRKNSCGKVIEPLLSSGGFSIEDVSSERDTALHVACACNNLTGVKALLTHGKHHAVVKCLEVQNRDGNTPLHLACMQCSVDICALLLQSVENEGNRESILRKKNKRSQTCLGISIKKEDWATAQLLLEHSYADPMLVYDDFKHLTLANEHVDFVKLKIMENEPMDVFVLGDQGSGKSTLIGTLAHAMQPTTLASFLTSFGSSSKTNMEKPGIGIVPTIVEFQKQVGCNPICPVVFHDVNSYHGYSHESIFKCCTRKPLDALYILCVDLTKSYRSSILYWLHFLCRKVSEYRVAVTAEKMFQRLTFIVAGTFADVARSTDSRQLDVSRFMTEDRNMDMFSSSLAWCGSFCVNAKKISSCQPIASEIISTCEQLHSTTWTEDEGKSLVAQTYVMGYLLSSFPKHEAIPFREIRGHVYSSTSNELCSLLPKDQEKLDLMCLNLRHFSQFKILTFTHSDTHQYVVIDHAHLHKSIEVGLLKLKQFARHGIVSRRDIKRSFDYPFKFVMYYLEHFDLCERISKNGLDGLKCSIRTSTLSKRSFKLSQNFGTQKVPLKAPTRHKRSRSDSESAEGSLAQVMSKKFSSKNEILLIEEPKRAISLSSEHQCLHEPLPSRTTSRRSSRAEVQRREIPYYFLPSLIPQTNPNELWERSSSEYEYGFAWCLLPQEGDTWFLSYKFTTVVLFRLLFSFAPCPTSVSEFSLDRSCQLWDEGISWCDPVGARICVAIKDRNKVILSMLCLKGSEIACFSIRNEIMKDIKDQLHEIHPGFTPRELILPYDGNQDMFPIFDLEMSYMAFDKEDIMKAIFQECPAVSTNRKHNKHVEKLLFFEPLCFLNFDLLHRLFTGDSDSVVNEDFFMTFAKALSKEWVHLAKHWEAILRKYYIESLSSSSNGPPHDIAFEMLLHLRDIDYNEPQYRIDTYQGLQKSLFEISIFSREYIQQSIS